VRRALVEPCVQRPVEVAFNPLYLSDLLQALGPDETLRLELRDAEGARPVPRRARLPARAHAPAAAVRRGDRAPAPVLPPRVPLRGLQNDRV
jgi:hypothetical protein